MPNLLKFSEMVKKDRDEAARYRQLGRVNLAAQIDAKADVAENWLKANKLWNRKSARGYSIHPIPKVTVADIVRNGGTEEYAKSVIQTS